jgi:hypothetical protein
MASIRIGAETHQKLKNIARQQSSKLTDLLDEIASLLDHSQLSPSELQTKLEAASQMHSFQKLLTEQVAKVLKAIGQQERHYLFPFTQELALIKDRTEQLAAGQEGIFSLVDIDERLQHVEQLIQVNKEALDKQYQLLMEV